MTIGERVRTIRKNKKVTQTDFAKLLDIKQSALSMIENGTNELSGVKAKVICMEYGVNYDWLMNGDGEMYAAVPPADDELEILIKTAMPNSDEQTHRIMKKMMKADDRFWENLKGVLEVLMD